MELPTDFGSPTTPGYALPSEQTILNRLSTGEPLSEPEKQQFRSYKLAQENAGAPLFPTVANRRFKQATAAETMVLDGWDAIKTKGIGDPAKFDLVPEDQRPLTARALFLSNQLNKPFKEVFDQLPAYELKYSQQFGPVQDPGAEVDKQMKLTLQRQRDQRALLFGTPGKAGKAGGMPMMGASMPYYDPKAYTSGTPDTPAVKGLLQEAHEAALDGKPVLEVMKSLSSMKDKPGFDPQSAQGWAVLAQNVYAKTWQANQEAKDVAAEVFKSLNINQKEFSDLQGVMPLLKGKSFYELGLVWRNVEKLAKESPVNAGDDYGALEKLGMIIGRNAERLGSGVANMNQAGAYAEAAEPKAGDVVDREAIENPRAWVSSQIRQMTPTGLGAADGGGAAGMGELANLFRPEKPKVTLTKEQADALSNAYAEAREEKSLLHKLNQLQKGIVDPVKGSGVFGYGKAIGDLAWNITDAGVGMLTYAAPGGLAVNMLSYVEDSAEKFREAGMDYSTAGAMGLVSGGVQMLGDLLQLKAMPGLNSLGKAFAGPASAKAALKEYVAAAAFETVVEIGQNQYADAGTQALFASFSKDVPGVDWEQVNKEAWASIPELVPVMLGLTAVGSGGAAIRNRMQARELAKNPVLLRHAGFSPELVTSISEAADPVKALQANWNQRQALLAPASAPVEDLGQVMAEAYTGTNTEYQNLIAEERAKHAQLKADLEREGIRLGKNTEGEGYTVSDVDGGNSMTFATPAEASAAAVKLLDASMMTRDQNFEDALSTMLSVAPEGRQIDIFRKSDTLLDQITAATDTGRTGDVASIWARAQQQRAKESGPVLEEDLNNPESQAYLGGLEVLGRSETRFKEKVATSVSTLYRSGNIIDLVEENAENDLREWTGTGTSKAARLGAMAKSIRKIEAVTGDVYLHGEENETSITEAWSALVRLYTTGTHRGGNAITKAARADRTTERKALFSVAREARAALKAAEGQGVEPSTFQKLRDHFTMLKATLGQVARLMKAQKEGKLAAVEDFIRKSIGLDQEHAHAEAVASEAVAAVEAAEEASGIIYGPNGSVEYDARAGFSLGGANGNLSGLQREGLEAQALDVGINWIERMGEHTGSSKYGYLLANNALFSIRVADHANRSEVVNQSSANDVVSKKLIKATGEKLQEWIPARLNIVSLKGLHPQSAVAAEQLAQEVIYRLPADAFRTVDEVFFKNPLPTRSGAEMTVTQKHGADSKYVWLLDLESADGEQSLYGVEIGRSDFNNKWTETRDSISYSLAPASRLAALEVVLRNRLNSNPEARLRVLRDAQNKLQKLQYDWSHLRYSTEGAEIKPLVAPMSKGALDKEQALRRANREEELTEPIEHRYEQALNDTERANLYAHPLVDFLLGKPKPGSNFRQGKMMPYSYAIKHGYIDRVNGEYDNRDGVPQMFFKGRQMVDDVAKEAYEAYPEFMRDDSPEALFDAIKTAVVEVSRNREELRKAQDELRAARLQAKTEAAEWRAARDEEQKRDHAPKAGMLRDMRTLEAILMTVPAEVRGKVGGMTALASMGSDAARYIELERRIGIMAEELERHLKKELTEQVTDLLRRGQPDREPGKKSKGHLGVEGHRAFKEMLKVYQMNPKELQAHQAGLDTLIAEADTADEKLLVAIFEQQQIADYFGGWKKKSAVDMDAALNFAQDIFTAGRNKWGAVEMARLQEMKKLAAAVVEANGGGGYAAITSTREKNKKTIPTFKALALDLKSFHEILTTLLGKDNPLARRWTDAVRTGYMRKEAAVAAANNRFKNAVEAASGKRGRVARRWLHEMAHGRTLNISTAGKLSTTTEDVPIEIYQRMRTGEADFTQLGYTKEDVALLTQAYQARMEEIADLRALGEDSAANGLIARESIPLERSSRGEAEHVPMTPAEALFLSMIHGQEAYRDALDKHGWDAQAMQEIEDILTPEMKQLRAFLSSEYKEGYAPMAEVFRRMFGVDLPSIRNYAPASFYHTGVDNPPGPEGNAVNPEGGFRAGFLANRKQHSAPPKIENAFAVWNGHVAQGEHWKHLAETARELKSVFSRPEVKMAVEGMHGKEMLNAVNDWIRAIEGNGLSVSMGVIDKFATFLSGVQANIVLAYNIGTVAKQSSALLGAWYKMPTADYLRGLKKLFTGQLEYRKMLQSPMIQARLLNGYSPEVRAIKDTLWNSPPTAWSDFRNFGLEVIGGADALFTTGSAAIAYDYHFHQAKKSGMDDTQAERLAMEETERIVSQTAQPATLPDKSLFENRGSGVGKLLFLFASEARQKTSLYLSAMGNIARSVVANEKIGKEDVRVMVIAHLVVAPMMQAIGAMLRDAMDGDDDEIFDVDHWKPMDFVKAAWAGPFGGFPILGQALSGFAQKGILGRFQDAINSFEKLMGDESLSVEDRVKAVTKIGQGTTASVGVVAHIVQQAFGLIHNLVDDEQNEGRKQLLRESKSKAEAKTAGQTPEALEAAEEEKKRKSREKTAAARAAAAARRAAE